MTDEQTLFTWAEFVLNSKTTWYKKTLHTFINLLPVTVIISLFRLKTLVLGLLLYLLHLLRPSLTDFPLMQPCVLLPSLRSRARECRPLPGACQDAAPLQQRAFLCTRRPGHNRPRSAI